MSAGPARDGGDPPPSPPSRRWLPFWALQAAELAVAVVFVDTSVHLSSSTSLLIAAALFAALAFTARGPLGILRICPRPLHARLVVLAAVVLALSPLLPVLRPDLVGIVVLEFGAVGLARMATLTRTATSPPLPAASDLSAGPTGPAEGDPSIAERSGRTAASAAVVGRRAIDRYGPAVEESTRRAVRGAGRRLGRALGARDQASPDGPPN